MTLKDFAITWPHENDMSISVDDDDDDAAFRPVQPAEFIPKYRDADALKYHVQLEEISLKQKALLSRWHGLHERRPLVLIHRKGEFVTDLLAGLAGIRAITIHAAVHAAAAASSQTTQPQSGAASLTAALRDLREAAQPVDDEEGDLPPSGVSVSWAGWLIAAAHERWASQLGEKALPLHVAATPVGGVHIEWEGPSNALQVNIDAEGGLDLLLIRGPRRERNFDERHDVSSDTVLEMIDEALGG